MSNSDFGYEIDFLPVGEGQRCGDAIAIRFGRPGNYSVLIYDGGTKDSGKRLVDHVQTHYKTDFVNHVVNSHPDGDHASGLSVVLENLQVGELWMHRPWEHSSLICDYFRDGRITENSLAERLKSKMSAAYALETIALEKGIPIREPFAGDSIGGFLVLSPDKEWYVHTLIQEFEKSPEAKSATDSAFARFLRKMVSWVDDRWDVETLRENVTTSAENESSVILYGTYDGRDILLTGDAGVRALTKAADYLDSRGVSLPGRLQFMQVPHHGSRNNVSPTTLDRLLGKRVAKGTTSNTTAFVSASSGSDTHPRKVVLNAFIRRGAKVFSTRGDGKWHHFNMGEREGWSAATPHEFSDQVEDWD